MGEGRDGSPIHDHGDEDNDPDGDEQRHARRSAVRLIGINIVHNLSPG